MIDVTPLVQAHDQMTASLATNAADPNSAIALTIVGMIIIAATALGCLGGLSAAVQLRLSAGRERRLHAAERGRRSPSAR